jgi:hypothetical protein
LPAPALILSGQPYETARHLRPRRRSHGHAAARRVGPPITNSQVRNNDTFGVIKLTLYPTSYDWQFIPAAGGGGFTDSGSGNCH